MLSFVGYSNKKKNNDNLQFILETRKDEIDRIIDNLMNSLCCEILYYIVENVDRTLDKDLMDKFLEEDIENKEEIYSMITKIHRDKIEEKSLYFMKSDLDLYIFLSKIKMIIIRLNGLNKIKKYRDRVEKIIRYGELNNGIIYPLISQRILDIFE